VGVVDLGMWLHTAGPYFSCALVRGCGVVFRHCYHSMARKAGKVFHDGAVVLFKW
jgi:hypothetical protein